MDKIIKKIKKLFKRCDHEWSIYDASFVHYPDYEPFKIGVKEICHKCGKKRRFLLEPSKNKELCEFIKNGGFENEQ